MFIMTWSCTFCCASFQIFIGYSNPECNTVKYSWFQWGDEGQDVSHFCQDVMLLHSLISFQLISLLPSILYTPGSVSITFFAKEH